MKNFSVTILGCGSAKPTLRHFGSSQIVNYGGRLFMIDCAEGTQIQFRRFGFHDSRLNHIFISHAHGDHCLGLIGLLSSYALSGRYDDIHVYAPSCFEDVFLRQMEFFVLGATFSVLYHPIEDYLDRPLYEDSSLIVKAIPLQHRVPCFGFLFCEKYGDRHIKPECIDQYKIPVSSIKGIKNGLDFTTVDGVTIPNVELTTSHNTPRSYAYCCDTAPVSSNVELLRGVDLLYHDATYLESEAQLAEAMFHSTARQAAEFAGLCGAKRLVIGHFSSRYGDEMPLLNEARAVFDNTILADEGLKVEIP